MTITMHLGVIDLPYAPQDIGKIKIKKKAKGKFTSITTGDVAQILEDEYHVMEHFFNLHGEEISDHVGDAIKGSLETMLMGGPDTAASALESAASPIEDLFKNMISNKELDALGYPGIPTKAAQKGVNHRMKHPYAKRPARPSFRDTGLYQSSFKVWFD